MPGFELLRLQPGLMPMSYTHLFNSCSTVLTVRVGHVAHHEDSLHPSHMVIYVSACITQYGYIPVQPFHIAGDQVTAASCPGVGVERVGLKGQSNEIFYLHFFHEPTWDTNQQVKRFLILVKNLLSYSNFKSDSPGYDTLPSQSPRGMIPR